MVKLDQRQDLKNEWKGGRCLDEEGGGDKCHNQEVWGGGVLRRGKSYVEIVRKEPWD